MKKTYTTNVFWFAMIAVLLFNHQMTGQISPKNPFDNKQHKCSRHHLQENKSSFSPPKELKYTTSDFMKSANCGISLSQWSSYSSNQLINQLAANTDYECFRPMWTWDPSFSPSLFTEAKINAVANEIESRSTTYDGTLSSGLYGMLIYLQIAAYHDFFESSFQLTTNNKENTRSACVALASTTSIRNMTTDNLEILGQLLSVADADGIRSETAIIDLMQFLMVDATVTESWQQFSNPRDYYVPINNIFFIMFRGGDDQDFLDAVENDLDFFDDLLAMAIDAELMNDSELSLLSSNAALEYIRFAEHFPTTIEPGLIAIINTYPRLSNEWILAMEALNNYGDCAATTVCEDIDDIRDELNEQLFPNTFSFDDGKMLVNTPLSLEEVQLLYHAAKEVQAGFFNMIGTDQPVQGDTNEVLTMYVFGSLADYDNYATLLFGIPSNNGGMYIERGATFYTWDRTVGVESSFSLEALFRHEYVHYLQGRYLIPGYWGEGEIYDNSRLVWFEEGMGEFFAGSTDTEGIVLPEHNAYTVRNTNSNDWPALDVVYNSSYSSGNNYHYTYGNMLWHNLYQNDPQLMSDFFNAARANDVTTFDQLVANNRFSGQIAYEDFLTDVQNGSIATWDLLTSWIPADQTDAAALSEIKNDFESTTGLTVSNIDFDAFTLNKRFKIEGSLSGSDTFETLNSVLTHLENNASLNNFEVAVGYLKNNTGTSADFVITGPLQNQDPNASVPTISITSHQNNQEILIGQPQTFIASVSHDKPIFYADLKLNGMSLGVVSDANYTWSDVDFTDVTPGVQNLELLVVDDYGTLARTTLMLNVVLSPDVFPTGYCTAINTDNDSYITSVAIGSSIDQSSGHDGYSNYSTAQQIDLEQGETSTISIGLLNDWPYNDIGVWVDWNRNGSFEDAGENIINIYGEGPYNNISFTVPEDASVGLTRMRVRYSYGSEDAAIPCGTENYFGEVEDYGINIIGDPLSVEDMENQDNTIKVFPNPSADGFYIYLPGDVSQYQAIKMYSLSGQLVESHDHSFTGKAFGKDLPSGSYILTIVSNNYGTINKLVIKK